MLLYRKDRMPLRTRGESRRIGVRSRVMKSRIDTAATAKAREGNALRAASRRGFHRLPGRGSMGILLYRAFSRQYTGLSSWRASQ